MSAVRDAQGGVAFVSCIMRDVTEKLRAERHIEHLATTDTLTGRDITRLADAVTSVLQEAVEAGGSTLADTQYVDVEGNGGWFQVHHRVYDRAGEPCLTCARGRILRTVAAGRTTCFCPRCQR